MNLLIISSYPQKGKTHSPKTVGVASYAKNTIKGLKSLDKNLEITVLAEKFHRREGYEENGIKIKRIWKRNSFSTFFILLKTIKNPGSKILIELELAMFGSMFNLALFPLFLALTKIFKKKTVIVLHQFVSDINELHGHTNIKRNSIKAFLINFFIQIFYKALILLSSKIIVFEDVLKEKLSHFGDRTKIVVIPHGVEDFNNLLNKIKARKKLDIPRNKFVVLYFGFIAWYKGPDILISNIKDQKSKLKNLQLIIAGGPNPNHAEKGFYQKYVNKIKKDCRDNKFIYTGFVKEKEIPLYYKACDLVILPYRTLMSSSGPLSLAFSFEKPVLISKSLEDLLKTKDIKETSKKLKIKDLLVFKSNDEIIKKIEKLNKKNLRKLKEFAKSVKKKRAWDVISKKYYEEIFNTI